tara:strand:+ start:3040 stop:3291 length:252 start_codon:yes stop_codon:yes gene_type:complete
MAILSYKSEEPLNREATNISFDMPDDMNIHEFKIMCVRLASAMGYTDTTIKKAFGDTDYESDADREFKEFIKSIGQLTGSLTF